MTTRKKSLITLLLFSVLGAVSCDKDQLWRGTGFTSQFNPLGKPVLEISVVDWDPSDYYGPFINKCLVKIYTSEQDFIQNGNAIDSGFTNYLGSVSFILDS
jgi:hypothetical protein